ncbi:MAG: PAS domain-containing protein [Alloprevotella sp.]|nr:PAS domain-containing protein [Bacteroidales bacterium]MCI6644118.1 PAS domain-containing protein [Bacteroidales bacterium]MDY3943271.1 PAS domain-containing protein [Alloprevotella sp.]
MIKRTQMMSEMKSFLPGVDAAKVARMHEIRSRYENGTLTLEAARAEMAEKVGRVSAQEYALMEQTYVPVDDAEQCRIESLKDMTLLFGESLVASRPDLPEGHPVDTYYKECLAVRNVVARMMGLLEKDFIKNPWLEAMDDLAQVKVHYSRKQNQLYSVLEQKGFMHPSKTMWTYDDYNRDAINHARALLDDDRIDQFLAYVPTMLHGIVDLMDKEEAILLPTSLSMISEEEFKAMREGDDEIGYCLIPAPKGFRTVVATSPLSENTATSSLADDLQALLAKHGLNAPAADGILDVATGKLTLEQINLIFRHMPVDLSYVDEHEIVKFYTDTEHRVFPRSAGVIGRQVKNCHPPKSVHVVEEIIEKFRSGEQSRAEFWINKPDLFIYIVYVAVRDKEGNFRGVLEMMQNCTHIRALQGSQTLLNWANEAGIPAETPQPEAPIPPAVAQPVNESVEADMADGEVNEQSKIFELLARYPQLKQQLRNFNEQFSMLSHPILSRIAKAANPTVKTAAERVGVSVEELVAKIRELIKK